MTLSLPVAGGFALVDDHMYDVLARHQWHLDNKGYVVRSVTCFGESKQVFMHHMVLILHWGYMPDGLFADHIDCNKQNNTLGNLRWVTKVENNRNRRKDGRLTSSRFYGVRMHAGRNRWLATVSHFGKKIHVGYFDTEEEAARARDEKVRELRTGCDRFNFPKGGELPAVTHVEEVA